VNFEETVALMEALLPNLRAVGDGRVVNVASMAGTLRQLSPALQQEFASEALTVPKLQALVARFEADVQQGVHREREWSNSNYGLSKLAVIAYTNVLARQEPDLHVNACCPGYCATDMTSNQGTQPAEIGARTPVALALIGKGGPTGEFWEHEKPSKW